MSIRLLTHREETDLLLNILYNTDDEATSISKRILDLHNEYQILQEHTDGDD